MDGYVILREKVSHSQDKRRLCYAVLSSSVCTHMSMLIEED